MKLRNIVKINTPFMLEKKTLDLNCLDSTVVKYASEERVLQKNGGKYYSREFFDRLFYVEEY